MTSDDAPGNTAAAYYSRGWWRHTTHLDDFLRHAERQPGKGAVISDHADREPEQHTYGELAALVDQAAAGLVALGVRPGEIVSYQLPTGGSSPSSESREWALGPVRSSSPCPAATGDA